MRGQSDRIRLSSIDRIAAVRIGRLMRGLLIGLLLLGCSSATEKADTVDAGPDAPNAAEIGASGGWLGDPCDPDAQIMTQCGPMIYDQCFPSSDGGSCSEIQCLDGKCFMRCAIGVCSQP